MNFNSWEYIIFFLVVYIVYLLLPRYRWQNVLLLLASYYFYAAWNWKLTFLIFGVTVVNFIAGSFIAESTHIRRRKFYLATSIICNLAVLCFFKYYNFFLDSLDGLLAAMGFSVATLHLNILLPVGISFYTFSVISYSIDVYRNECEPARNFLDFAVYVAFFPKLLAGPIERAARLLPQISSERTIDASRIKTGCWLLFWGLYKKIVIADNLSTIADQVFASSATATCLSTYLGGLAFTIQIYCDFSAFTDIARGCSRLLGIELMRNFNLPLTAKDPSDYWRRWHISLSTWLRDYLYIPLGGNRKGRMRTYLNLFLTMSLGGLWHGAAWNYIWWGVYHGILLMGHRLFTGRKKSNHDQRSSPLASLVKVFAMFQLSLLGWIFFRSNRTIIEGNWPRDDSLNQIIEFLTSYKNGLGFNTANLGLFYDIIMYSLPLAFIQWLQLRSNNHYAVLEWQSAFSKAVLFSLLFFTWLIWGVQSGDTFIYFQF